MDSFMIDMAFTGFLKERKKNKEPVPTDMAEALADDAYVSGGFLISAKLGQLSILRVHRHRPGAKGSHHFPHQLYS